MIPADFNWKKPDYAPVLMERARRLSAFRTDDDAHNRAMVKGLKEYYRDRPVEFLMDWGMTVDPRNAEIGLPSVVPFLLFPKQVEFVNWLYARWRGREDGLCEKSRDMGVSWLAVGFAVWMWLFYPDSSVGVGSRKEEYVDKIGDPKSLFWKIRKFIELLPAEFLPEGYRESKHAPSMRCINPENGAVIFGEAGDNIGRGARASLYVKDESAHYDHDNLIDAALSQTSNCKIDISSVNGMDNAFARRRFGGNVPVFIFDWRDDPRKEDAWYLKQKASLDKMIVAQEIDRDYSASVTNSFIDNDLISAAMDMDVKDVEATGQWIIGIDAAHEGNDESVIHSRRGLLNLEQKIYSKLDGHDLGALVEAHCDDLEKATGIRVCALVIEMDGPGVSCRDFLRRGKYGSRIVEVHTGNKLKDNRHYNVRAKLWSEALKYLKAGGCRLARDNKLKMQLSSMRYSYPDGLLLMQNKKEYKSKVHCSPDRADGFVLTHADLRSVMGEEMRGKRIRVVRGYDNRKR